jgi:hypothetical protein
MSHYIFYNREVQSKCYHHLLPLVLIVSIFVNLRLPANKNGKQWSLRAKTGHHIKPPISTFKLTRSTRKLCLDTNPTPYIYCQLHCYMSRRQQPATGGGVATNTGNGGTGQVKQQQDQRHREASTAYEEVEEAGTCTQGRQEQQLPWRSEGVLRGFCRPRDEEVCDPHGVPWALGV